MKHLKLFEDFEEQPYAIQIDTRDFLDYYNQVNNMVPFEDYDYNLLKMFVKKIPFSKIEKEKELRKRVRTSYNTEWEIESIKIVFSNMTYALVKIYKTQTNYFAQIFEPFEPVAGSDWVYNYYKLHDIYDVISLIKEKYNELYKVYYVSESALSGLKNEDGSIEGISGEKFMELTKKIIALNEGILGDKIYQYIKDKLLKIFNHNNFKFEYGLNSITVYENENTTIAFFICLIEDDYFIVKFDPSNNSYYFLCDGIRGLLKLIKGQYEQFQKSKSKLYYEINELGFDYPKNNLTLDGADVVFDNNSEGELKKLENYLKDIKDLEIRRVGLFNYQISIKGRNYFETFTSSEYNWWVVRNIKPNLSSNYYLCISMRGLKELIQDIIYRDKL